MHWIVPALSGLLTGFGLLSIFLQCINYIVDAYLMFAASALAANTFLRSLFGACFPLFSVYMFDGMGIQWASTLLGCLAAAMVPIPVIFYVYGRRLRRRSRFAPTFPLQPPPEPQEQSAEDARADAIGGPLANDNGAESDGATDQAVDSEKEKDVEVDPALAAAAPRSLTETAAA